MKLLQQGKRSLLAGLLALTVLNLNPGQAAAETVKAPSAVTQAAPLTAELENVTLVWDIVPDAAQYELVVFAGRHYRAANELLRQRGIYLNGVTLAQVPTGKAGLGPAYWFVRPLNLEGRPIGRPTRPQPLTIGMPGLEAPLPVSEMESMAYTPLYPVFAWLPYPHAADYEVEVCREQNNESIHLAYYHTATKEYYDDDALNQPGSYCWRVRARDDQGNPLSGWSPKRRLVVTAPTPIAALGDSITHGGGAANVPPCYRLYSWESYAGLLIKNLGKSGDTPAAMAARFERDVLPFAPRVLVIMGGVNDFREGTPARESICKLREIRRKCKEHGIIPVFATATPLNPAKMAKLSYIEKAAPDWRTEQLKLNNWIMSQRYAVDVTAALTAADGTLRAELTTDGLHPDSRGKQLIGKAIGNYLRETGLAEAAQAVQQAKGE